MVKKNFLPLLTLLFLFSGVIMAQTIPVTPAQGLNSAIDFANAGNANVLELTDAVNPYYLSPTTVSVPLTIRAAEGLSGVPTIITMQGGTSDNFIVIQNDLHLKGITIDGLDPATAQYDSVRYLLKINATVGGPNETPDLTVEDCYIKNIYRYGDPATSVDGNIFDVSTSQRAGDVRFERTTLENTGDEAIRAINTHKEPVPLDGTSYSTLTIRNCTFININGSAIKIE
ncbi:MAG: hypothetical protein KKA84_16475, partial [Bacteroidetes bacterium]|nr:hypothetical protein [Bacteroidota bacterium]